MEGWAAAPAGADRKARKSLHANGPSGNFLFRRGTGFPRPWQRRRGKPRTNDAEKIAVAQGDRWLVPVPPRGFSARRISGRSVRVPLIREATVLGYIIRMTPKGVLLGLAFAVAVAPWATAELVEVAGEGVTVYADGDPATIPEQIRVNEDNYLQFVAVFDSERSPIAQSASSAQYEALYGYGLVNGEMVELSNVTLTVGIWTGEGSTPWFYLSGTTPDGWTMWMDGYSEGENFVSPTAVNTFPVDGFHEPEGDLYRRCDIGATGPGWDAFSDQTDLPTFSVDSDPAPVEGQWYNVPFQLQYGRFTVRYHATPSSSALDAVTGLSRTAADFFTDLAPIVRFAPSGRIDARNGDRYRAVQSLAYQAGVTYQVEMTVDLWTKRYRATVTPPGGTPVVIANDYAFRTEHARANELGYFNYYSVGGTLEVRGFELVTSDSGTLFSAGTWENASLPPHGNPFTVEYDVTPSRAQLDAVTGLSHGAADWFTDLAVIVRFAPSGLIDARDDNQYRAVTSVPYQAGVSYCVRLTVDLATKRFSATVQPEDGAVQTIANQYRFRREQANVAQLDTFALFSNGGGASEVTHLTVP